MEVDGCREIGTELENFENIPFRGWIWSSTSADSLMILLISCLLPRALFFPRILRRPCHMKYSNVN
jgi:hypothetical protein